MRTRAEAVEFVNVQLHDCVGDLRADKKYPPIREKTRPWNSSYGAQELRELFDFLYDGPPGPGEHIESHMIRTPEGKLVAVPKRK